jgi:hypothetical protein
MKTDVLGYLISANWLIGEAAAQDVAVTDRQSIERKVLGRATKATQKRSFAAFKAVFRKRWTARTDCRPGYAVLDCRQYRAPGSR